MSALVDVTMPRLSDSMEEATVLRWLKRPGEAVRKGEPLVEVETDKATVVYEAERDGVLAEIVVGENESAALGAVIARLAVEGLPPAPAPETSTRRRATPVARRVAAELGVDLSGLDGSGPGGRIVEADVRAARPSAPAPEPVVGGRGQETVVEPTATQRTSRSPQFTKWIYF